VSLLCELYPGICHTTEEKAQKPLKKYGKPSKNTETPGALDGKVLSLV
jgi:hypothetical protein